MKIGNKIDITISEPPETEYCGIGIIVALNENSITLDLNEPIVFKDGKIKQIVIHPRLSGEHIDMIDRKKIWVGGKGLIDPATLGQYKGYRFFLGSAVSANLGD